MRVKYNILQHYKELITNLFSAHRRIRIHSAIQYTRHHTQLTPLPSPTTILAYLAPPTYNSRLVQFPRPAYWWQDKHLFNEVMPMDDRYIALYSNVFDLMMWPYTYIHPLIGINDLVEGLE